jgi:hypothetical protein
MWNDTLICMFLAPGLATCYCFYTDGFVKSLRKGFENLSCCRGRFWRSLPNYNVSCVWPAFGTRRVSCRI